jgi:Flp pilus assembly protein TadG
MRTLLKLLRRNEDGATAVEFALYSTVFFSMLFGGIYASLLGFTSASLQSATESAARCRAMGVTCTDSATTQTYALTVFHSVSGVTPTFTTTTDTCGSKVVGQMNYNLKYIIGQRTIALASSACFPAQAASTS